MSSQQLTLGPPPSSQLHRASASVRPESFHPSFDKDAKNVVFMVGVRGFKVDAARLASHSEFLRNMLYDEGGLIGLSGEGSEEFPIILEGCTETAFAHFLLWLDHHSWAPLEADRLQQLLDILHISHMWEILPGIDFASTQLRQHFSHELTPARALNIACRYNLIDWVDGAVRLLLSRPLRTYSIADRRYLGYELYSILASAKESIAFERLRLGNHPPFPRNFDDGPFCPNDQHATCKRVWTERWFLVIGRKIHDLSNPLPLTEIPNALEAIDHRGMNPGCKDFLLTWLRGPCEHIQREETIIQATVRHISDMM